MTQEVESQFQFTVNMIRQWNLNSKIIVHMTQAIEYLNSISL